MTRILCVANQKGGVGKTTTAINVAAGLSRSGARTLLIDLDPQCNATSGLGQKPIEAHPLAGGRPLREGVTATYAAGLDVLPGSRKQRDIELLAAGNPELAAGLREQLTRGLADYDAVVLDCPPSLGPLTEAALAASSEVLMPIQCEYFAMEGLAEMIQVIARVMKQRDGKLEFGGIVLTMVDPTLELTQEVDREVREFFGEIVFKTVIPRDAAVAEAPSHGRSVLDYAPRSRGSRAYIELCMEVLGHE